MRVAKARHVAVLSLLASRSLAAIAVVAIVAAKWANAASHVVCKSSGHATALGRGRCLDLVGVLVLDPGEGLEKSGRLLLSRWCMCVEGTR